MYLQLGLETYVYYFKRDSFKLMKNLELFKIRFKVNNDVGHKINVI